MKDVEPPVRDAVEAAVSDAYRELPQPEPAASLDAQIRASVANVVANETVVEARHASAPHPAWRRAAPPMAIAATLVIAFGVGSLWLRDGGQHAELTPIPAAISPTDVATAPETTAAKESAPTVVTQLPPAQRAAPKTSLADAVPAAAVPAPPPKLERAAAPASELAPMEKVEPQTPAEAPLAAKPAAAPVPEPGLAAPRARVQHEPVRAAAPPATVREDSDSSLDTVRDLLRAGHRTAAKEALLRWRESHPGAEIPDDLRLLAAEPPSTSTSAP